MHFSFFQGTILCCGFIRPSRSAQVHFAFQKIINKMSDYQNVRSTPHHATFHLEVKGEGS